MRTSTIARKTRRTNQDELARIDFEKFQAVHEAAEWDAEDLGLDWDESEARRIATDLVDACSPHH